MTPIKKWPRIGCWAAIVGGLCWVTKGGLILLAGDQPPILFEIAPAFFALALVELSSHVNGRSRLAQIGVVLAVLGGGAAILNSLRELWMVVTGTAITEIELISALAGFGWLLGLLLVGIPVWRRKALPGKWRYLPFSMGIVSFPLIILFATIGEVSTLEVDLAQRLIEIPLVLIGLGWIGLGWQMLAQRSYYLETVTDLE